MHPSWQLLERHQAHFSALKMLWLDAPESHGLIKSTDQAICLDRSAFNTPGLTTLSPDEPWPDQTEGIILFYPKAKERLAWWLHQIASFVQRNPNCRLWVVGENKGGIKSLPKRVLDWASTEKWDSARHCVLHQLHPAPDHTLPQAPTWTEFEYQGRLLQAGPGVFSQNRLDKGTALLLGVLPALKGHCLDFGCGSGVIAQTLLSQSDTVTVTALDIDWLAVRSCEKNLARVATEDRYRVIWSDGLAQLDRTRFNAIITNPPFHTGIRTHYEASEQLFRASADWLVSGGTLWWVANEFLDYQSCLPATVGMVEEMAHGRGFKVYRAKRK
ncbi:class I SAM-dependent methyltransferase [Saccharospirillum impatiens]|uniref:class I SAM-dependent methyltransferase n=1 Tax=Saccharospirillum impatiens TaxID=169438 RepID=UPI00040606DF|nr:class I SAM-dependent methyltransferase [Saccharospirillum impatiens]